MSFGFPAEAETPSPRPLISPYHHCCPPEESLTTRGACSRYLFGTLASNMSAGSMIWSSTLIKISSFASIVVPHFLL